MLVPKHLFDVAQCAGHFRFALYPTLALTACGENDNQDQQQTGDTGAPERLGQAPGVSRGLREWNPVTTWPKNFPGQGTGAQRLGDQIMPGTRPWPSATVPSPTMQPRPTSPLSLNSAGAAVCAACRLGELTELVDAPTRTTSGEDS